MKKIFVIDLWLVVIFAIVAISGFGMHISGHRSIHEVWHNWAVVHTLSSVVFIIVGVLHIQTHWTWYKSLFRKGLGNKSRVTVILSVIYLIATITGLILLAVHGANSEIGWWHYRIGILLTIIGLGHIFKRLKILRKSITK